MIPAGTTRCIWCRVPIVLLIEGDTLWSNADLGSRGPLVACTESMLHPPVHLPVGEDGWFPSPRYRGIEWR